LPQFDDAEVEKRLLEIQREYKIIDEQFFISDTFYIKKLDTDRAHLTDDDYKVVILEKRNWQQRNKFLK
jgi:hypothetical protein